MQKKITKFLRFQKCPRSIYLTRKNTGFVALSNLTCSSSPRRTWETPCRGLRTQPQATSRISTAGLSPAGSRMDCVDGGQHVNETEWRQEEETPHVLLAQEELSCGTFILVPHKFVCFFLSGCVPACRHGARGKLLPVSTAKALQSQFTKTEEAESPGTKPPVPGDTQHPAVPCLSGLRSSAGATLLE